MARPILQLQATDEELIELGRMVRGTKVAVGDRFRAKIILLRLEGKAETEVRMTLKTAKSLIKKAEALYDSRGSQYVWYMGKWLVSQQVKYPELKEEEQP